LRKQPFQFVKKVRRRGKVYFYLNDRRGPLVRLPGAWGSAEFQEAYKAALAGGTAQKIEIGAERTKAGSVSAAVVTYLNSVDFAGLAEETRRVRRHLLDRFREQFGELPLVGLTKSRIEAIMAQKQAHPARNLLKALRGVIAVALRGGLIEIDPTLGVHKPKVRDTGGYRTWTDAEIATFETFYPIGTRERLAFALFLRGKGAPMFSAWGASMFGTDSSRFASKRQALSCASRFIPSFGPFSPRTPRKT
jgi:hypothetical protein